MNTELKTSHSTSPGVAGEIPSAGRRPRATYRFQFHAGWTLGHAREQLDYLAALGISDLYASPLLLARPGSTHGYDVCDPARLNPELGTMEDWAALQLALRRRGMGLLLDIVPNHMGVGHHANRWWWETLQLGEASPCARRFDIQWDGPGGRRQVEVPILGRPLPDCLSAGEVRVRLGKDAFVLAYHDRLFPLSPGTWMDLLLESGIAVEGGLETLERSLRAWAEGDVAAGRDAQTWLRQWLETHAAERGRLESFLATLHAPPGEALGGILEHQHYRLTFWREGRPNYRRFFDVTDLAAVRVEDPEVFEAVHARILDWVARGEVTGLRVDHPDGLRDPEAYFLRLQAACLARRHPDPAAWTGATEDYLQSLPRRAGPPPFHVVAEKILSQGESLPASWRVHGTTGYEFLNATSGLFVDPQGCRTLSAVYRRFTGETTDFDQVSRQGKRDVLDALFPGELHSLAGRLHRLARGQPDCGWLSLADWVVILREWIAALPVYRTYLSPSRATPTPEERGQIDQATHRAAEAHPELSAAALLFLQRLMERGLSEDVPDRGEVLEFVLRLQQLTGPATAKGVEDTAFYRHYRLASLNEVGGDPGRDGESVEAFHRFQKDRCDHWPHGLSCTATHDTKRGEDVRARLHVLSERPDEWEQAVTRWGERAAAFKTSVGGRWAPSPNDEYLVYQTLVGTWPGGLGPEALPGDYPDRIAEYLVKAAKESKRQTSWIHPDTEYEEAARRFVEGVLGDEGLRAEIGALAGRLARPGLVNSLAQTLVKLTAPGVPDIYQGTECWDLSLVDPDNRRPVDYAGRRRMLNELRKEWEAAGAGGGAGRRGWLGGLLEAWADGRVKMFTLWRGLECRRERAAVFAEGSYLPMGTAGPRSGQLCAFGREHEGRAALVVVPRCAAGLLEEAGPVRFRDGVWDGTRVMWPEEWAGWEWRDGFSGEEVSGGSGGLEVGGMLRVFPVALLTGRGDSP